MRGEERRGEERRGEERTLTSIASRHKHKGERQNEDMKTRDQRRNQNEAKSIHHVSKIGPNQCVRVGVYL